MGPSSCLGKLPCGLMLLLVSSTYASLPYMPTRILATPKGSGHDIYIIEPPSPSWPEGRLSKLSQRSNLRPDNLPTSTISTLPFLKHQSNTSFTSVITQNGLINVYAGDCSDQGKGASLWQFTPTTDSGWWSERSYNIGKLGQTAAVSGANWLATGVSFSSDMSKPDNFFIFGGMCPLAEAGSSSSWTSDATYSNQLLVFQSQPANNNYDFTLTPGNGQPTPEAGFTMTPLTPTHSISADGSQTQQQDFVLIGGHTDTAFINMNMIALFSLPQSSWTFLSVEIPSSKSDLLASRNEYYVDSRSGHTAVLTPDGERIIVFGGWVGDVSTPAEPQLTILEVGSGYGGSGPWKWSNSRATPFASGEGLYGHSAVMLPGDVMLITGGFNIHGPSSSYVKRSSQTHNKRNLFLNTTSGEWLRSYNVGKVKSIIDSQNGGSGPLGSNNQKAGLIAGLTFGLLAIVCIIFFFVCYRRRARKQREEYEKASEQMDQREKEIDALAASAAHHGELIPHLDGTSIDGRGGSIHAYSVWDGRRQQRPQAGHNIFGASGSGIREAQRSGVDVNVPSPHRGLRHSIARRPVGYHSAPRYDDSRYHWSSGDMHAIEEKDEENSSAETSRQPSVAHARPDVAMVNDRNDADPFRDPDPEPESVSGAKTLRRATNQISRQPLENLSPAEERHREMSGWIRDWAVADAVSRNNTTSTSAGRSSPSKSDRTESNLSDRSSRSNYSARSGTGLMSSANSGPSRNTSANSGIRSYLPNIFPAIITNPFGASTTSPTHETSSSESTNKSGPVASGASGPEGSNASRPGTSSGSGGDVTTDRTDSFATAKSTTSHGTAENEALLAPHADSDPTFTRRRANSGSPIRAGRPSIIGGWVGSVRRGVGKAITATVAGGRTASLTNEANRSRGVIGSDGYYEYTPTSSPAKSEHGNLTPGKERAAFLDEEADEAEDSQAAVKRSVSEGAAFWTAKRGARDWEINAEPVPKLSFSRTRPDSQETVVPRANSQRLQPPRMATGWRREGAWRSESSTAESSSNMSNTTMRLGTNQSVRSASAGQLQRTGSTASDWDVEAAVEQRVVQVMFTVPREKLRVVNADVDVASLVSTLREDDDWGDTTRDLSGERIWAIAEKNLMEDIGESAEDGNNIEQPGFEEKQSVEPGKVKE